MTDYKARFNAVRAIAINSDGARPTGNITTVEKGGHIALDSQCYQIVKTSRYLDVRWKDFSKRKKDYWVTELTLFNVLTGETSHIEWEIDDELEVSFTLERISLLNVKFDKGHLKYSDLEAIAEEEEGTVSYKGDNFHYDEDETWAALYYGNDDDEPQKVRMFEFSGDGDKGLTIELWEDEGSKPEKEAFISVDIKPGSISVIQLKSAAGEAGL